MRACISLLVICPRGCSIVMPDLNGKGEYRVKLLPMRTNFSIGLKIRIRAIYQAFLFEDDKRQES